MIYKIGSVPDMDSIVFENDTEKQVVYHYANILTTEYGADRNVDKDDGGYILYAPSGTKASEIKTFFKYDENIAEFVDIQDGICSAVYILSSDYGVVLVMSLADTPPEILKEMQMED